MSGKVSGSLRGLGLHTDRAFLRIVLTALVLLCGSSAWGATTPDDDDDVIVTIHDDAGSCDRIQVLEFASVADLHSNVPRGGRNSLGPAGRDGGVSILNQPSTQVGLAGICRSNR